MKEHTTRVVRKYFVDGRVEEVDEGMTLDDMQKFVGGYIEMVPSKISHRSVVVNEDGLGLELPHNVNASAVLHPLYVVDFIRGNALLVKS